MLDKVKIAFGEFLGTFILVFIGCSSVALETLHACFNSLAMVASIWGAAVVLAILLSRPFSPAHLNPAVSIGMALFGKTQWKNVPLLISFQFLGAFLAGISVYLVFSEPLLTFELSQNILRGSSESRASALMFGEFFNMDLKHSHLYACLAESLGTFSLMLTILFSEKTKNIHSLLPALIIGIVLAIIIYIVAPLTQAGLNPARDFAPRIAAYIFGWKTAAFPAIPGSFFTVYIASPIIGAIAAALCIKYFRLLTFTKKFK